MRELMELELRARRRPSRLDGRRGLGNPEFWEVTEARRWTMRFVWTDSTGVGVGVKLRRAAAAAAEERLEEEGWELRKAWEAAVWADRVAEDERGCEEIGERGGH